MSEAAGVTKNGEKIPIKQRWWLGNLCEERDTGEEHGIRTVTYVRKVNRKGESMKAPWLHHPGRYEYAVVRYWDRCGDPTEPIDVILCSKGRTTWHPLT